MSRIGRTCSVPTEACAYQVPRVPCLREHLGQRVGVFGQVLQRHGAVLDEAHRLAVALQAHHDVEAGLAHLPQRSSAAPRRSSRRRCRAGRGRPSARPAASSLRTSAGLVVAGRTRPAGSASGSPISARLDDRREGRIGAAPARSSCGRPARRAAAGLELDDVLRRIHRLVEGREVHHAQHLGARQRRSCSVSARVSASVPSLPTSRCARLTLPSRV